MPIVTYDVLASSDDAVERADTTMVPLGNSSLVITAAAQSAGIRLSAPSAADAAAVAAGTLNSVTLRVYLNDATRNNLDCKIYAHDVNAPPTFSLTNGDISTRPRTTAFADVSLLGVATGQTHDVDMLTVLQELQASGYDLLAIAFVIDEDADANDTSIAAWDHSTQPAAQLIIDYTEAGISVALPPAVVALSAPTPTVALGTVSRDLWGNLVPNPSFEVDVSGWQTTFLGTNTLVRSAEQSQHGGWSGKATYQNSLPLADSAELTLTAQAHDFTAWVYVPTSWSGGAIQLQVVGFTGITIVDDSRATADLGLRDQWQRLRVRVTPDGADLLGFVRIAAVSAAAPGEFVYVDDVHLNTPAEVLLAAVTPAVALGAVAVALTPVTLPLMATDLLRQVPIVLDLVPAVLPLSAPAPAIALGALELALLPALIALAVSRDLVVVVGRATFEDVCVPDIQWTVDTGAIAFITDEECE